MKSGRKPITKDYVDTMVNSLKNDYDSKITIMTDQISLILNAINELKISIDQIEVDNTSSRKKTTKKVTTEDEIKE